MDLIKNFKQISKTDALIAGGKGASLGEMTQAKIPVPEGFVILSNVFDRFIEETDLNVEIDAVLDEVDIKKIHTVENASEKLKDMILSKVMPEDIKSEILKFHKNLNCKFVAVRSSATSEDSASAAWAGQLDSFLNTTEEKLLENIKKCWASLFTPRAIFYRFEKKFNKDKISVAVVVQKMVDSEESGIAFSVHPVTQDENQIIIEAGFGLGEAIVSGSITPDSYVIDKQGFNILDINVNEQTKALYKKAKGENEWKKLRKKGKKQVLTEKEIVELSKLIVKIENHYGFPCDIEWAKEKGKFYITQSRPITTLGGVELKEEKDSSLIDELIKRLAKTKVYHTYKVPSYTYFYSPILASAKLKYDAKPIFKDMIVKISNKDISELVVPDYSYLESGRVFMQKLIENDKTFTKILFSSIKELIDYTNELEKISYKDHKSGNITDINIFYKKYNKVFSQLIAYVYCLDFALQEYFQEKKIDSSSIKIPYKSFIQNEKEELKDAIENGDLKEHILKYNWILNNYVGEEKPKKSYFTGRKNEVEGLKKTSSNKIVMPKNIEEWIPLLIFTRDERKRCNLIAIGLMDRYLKNYCKKKNKDYNKLLLNSVEEIKEGDLTGDFVEDRYILMSNNKVIDITKEDWNRVKDFISDVDTKKLTGIVASKGIVEGRAKKVFSREEFDKVKKGDILVASMTRPDFAPILNKVAGIITNEGGVTCHAAIISREMNIPCIIGTRFATDVISDGDLVRLDANEGIVKILKKVK